ncbi:hypothetical protein [Priestia aryabhattai]|uniref:hypothetical protein n=1 Tax=Priestia aryabhattai TaxID=412384 RepID=UPI001CFA50EB|nr:hypothetical protein [Priestia aryabhattai]
MTGHSYFKYVRDFRCKRKKEIGVISYSLLVSGRLTCDWSEDTLRSETDETKKSKYGLLEHNDRFVVKRVG